MFPRIKGKFQPQQWSWGNTSHNNRFNYWNRVSFHLILFCNVYLKITQKLMDFKYTRVAKDGWESMPKFQGQIVLGIDTVSWCKGMGLTTIMLLLCTKFHKLSVLYLHRFSFWFPRPAPLVGTRWISGKKTAILFYYSNKPPCPFLSAINYSSHWEW